MTDLISTKGCTRSVTKKGAMCISVLKTGLGFTGRNYQLVFMHVRNKR